MRSIPIEELPEFGTFALSADNAAVAAIDDGDSATVTVPATASPGLAFVGRASRAQAAVPKPPWTRQRSRSG